MKKKVALALSSGGARGMAHIGVIEEILKQNMEITSIAGSSIGSLVGGIYAAGNLNDYTQWMKSLNRLDVLKLMDFAISKRGFIKGEKVVKELNRFLGEKNIEDLEIHYAAVAADFNTGDEVVFTTGPLIDAIRASVAIPTIFFPFEKENQELLDGGLVNPLPLNRVKKNDNELLIAVNLNATIDYNKPETLKEDEKIESDFMKKMAAINKRWSKIFNNKKSKKKKYGFYNLLTGSIQIMQNKLAERCIEIHKPDILVDISRNACDTLEFYRANEIIEAGRQAFSKSWNNYLKNSG